MNRYVARALQAAIDVAALSIAYALAFWLRFDGDLPIQMLKRFMFTMPYVVGFQYFLLVAFGVARMAWRYVSLRDLTRIASASVAAGVVVACARLASGWLTGHSGYFQYSIVPYGVVVADFILAFLAVSGVRVLRRIIGERRDQGRRRRSEQTMKATLLVGAGEAGVMVAKELSARPDLGIEPVGFLDDDPAKHGLSIHGLRVLGPTRRIAAIAARTGAEQVLVTIANAPGTAIRKITRACELANLPVNIIPGIYEIVGGRVNLSRIRPVQIEDLLGREAVELDTGAVGRFVEGRSVLVTGAGGSIGSELARQIARFSPGRLLLVERAENALFEAHRSLDHGPHAVNAVPLVADVADQTRMRWILDSYRPEVIFHAAAHKHVPMMEHNAGEAVKNNVHGTRVVADLADELGVGAFVMISTDKAVNPSSVMGASKRVAELYVQSLAERSKTTFVSVRFGNVLGSAGSVVPIFREQIARGGPVMVTHPEMRRYFMTIPEACQLVLQAGALGVGGEVFILDMGEPVRIVDLARDLIRLSGLEPDVDIAIEFVGVRPGEKLFEELSTGDERAERTRHPKIYIGRVARPDGSNLLAGMDRLLRAATRGHEADIRSGLKAIVPGFSGQGDNVIQLETADAG
jgi:FlaA1/EpsC-like NDP-sugar epimerase